MYHYNKETNTCLGPPVYQECFSWQNRPPGKGESPKYNNKSWADVQIEQRVKKEPQVRDTDHTSGYSQ